MSHRKHARRKKPKKREMSLRSRDHRLRKVRHHNFAGKNYRIVWTSLASEDAWGMCEPPTVKHKRIYLDPNRTPKELLAAVVDEAVHAWFWPLDNDYVDKLSTSLADFLWRIGYRLPR